MFEKITESDIAKRAVASVSTTPNRRTSFGESEMSAAQLKARFDLLPEYLANRLNEIFVSIGDGNLAEALLVISGDKKVKFADLVRDLLTGNVADINVKTIYETISLATLGAFVVEVRNGLASGELAERLMVDEDVTLKALYDRIKTWDGYLPIKGKDYFTPEDIQCVVTAVIKALPDGDEVSY